MTLAGWIVRAAGRAFLAAPLLALACAGTAAASNTMAVQPDGKIVLAGGAPEPQRYGLPPRNIPAIVRFNPDGQLDVGFGAGGGVVDFRALSQLAFTALGVTSSAVFAGHGEFRGGYRVERFESDGDADPGYGTGGISAVTAPLPPLTSRLSTILPLSDGSVIVGGEEREEQVGFAHGLDFAHRLGPDGAFAGSEGLIEGTSEDIGAPSGSELVRGEGGMLTTALTLTRAGPGWHGFIARFAPGGYDRSFGAGQGLVRLPTADGGPGGPELAPYPGGGFVLTSQAAAPPEVARVSAEGIPDLAFGEEGIARVPNGESTAMDVTAIAAQSDGKILVAGFSLDPCAVPPTEFGCWHVMVARFTTDGEPDPSFGDGGVVRLARHVDAKLQPVSVDVAPLAKGSILVSAVPDATGTAEFFLARLDPSGGLDQTFGQGGVATAIPCQGSLQELRRAGCLAHARANLRASGLVRGRPHGVLRIAGDNLLDPITEAVLVLPRALQGVGRQSKRVRAFGFGQVPLGKRVQRGRLTIRGGSGQPLITATIPPGVLKRVRRVDPRRKLRFRIQVRFADGSGQRLPLGVKP